MTDLTKPGRAVELSRFPVPTDEAPTDEAMWERFCTQPSCWQDDVLVRLREEIDLAASRAELLEADQAERYPIELIDRLREAGLLLIYSDEAEPVRTTCWHMGALNTMTSRRSTSLSIALGVNGLGLLPAYIAADPDQMKRIRQRVREGAFSSLLLTELDHGSNLLRTQASAEPGTLDSEGAFVPLAEGGQATHYRISGEKQLINGANKHDLLFTLLRTRPDPESTEGSRGPLAGRGAHSLFVIERQEGVRNLPRWHTLPAPAADISGCAFDQLIVPASARLGDEGEGFGLAQKTLGISRGGISAFASGTVARARDLVFGYAARRNVYGTPIANLTGIQDHLLRFDALERALCATSLRAAVWMNACGLRSNLYSGLSKYLCSALAEEAVNEARIVLGGRALLTELPFAQVSGDVQLFGVFDGTSHVMLEELQVRLTGDVRRWRKGQDQDRDSLAELRAMIPVLPARFSDILRVRSKQRSFLLPNHLRQLAAMDGVDLAPVVDAGTAIYALTSALMESGVWREDQGLRLQVARTYALVESLAALAELFDLDRRQALGAVAPQGADERDQLGYRYALAFLGQRAIAEIEFNAAQAGLPQDWERADLPGGLADIRARLLAGFAEVRSRLLEQFAP